MKNLVRETLAAANPSEANSLPKLFQVLHHIHFTK